jgi:Escherichia/Staphylococcus phage prohead protease
MVTYVDSHDYFTEVWIARAAIRDIVTEDVPGPFEATVAVFDSIAHSPKGPSRFAAGAFDRTVKAQPELPLLWQHKDDSPIGLADLRVVPGHGLVARCRLALGLPLAKEAHESMTLGAVNSVSIGFTSNPTSLEERVIGGERVRLISDCDVMEVSLVTFGADAAATVRRFPPTSRSRGGDPLAALALASLPGAILPGPPP